MKKGLPRKRSKKEKVESEAKVKSGSLRSSVGCRHTPLGLEGKATAADLDTH